MIDELFESLHWDRQSIIDAMAEMELNGLNTELECSDYDILQKALQEIEIKIARLSESF